MIFISKQHTSAKNRFIYFNQQIHALPSSWIGLLSSLRLPVLNGFWKGILREPFVQKRSLNVKDESIHDFISRRFNKATSLDLVSAIIHGIYAGNVHQLSVKSTLKMLWELEGEYGSIVKGLLAKSLSLKKTPIESDEWIQSIQDKTSVYSFKKGLGYLVNRLVEYLTTCSNVQIIQEPCIQLEFKKDIISVATSNHLIQMDHVFSSLPAYSLSSLLPEPISGYLKSIPFVDVAVVNILFPKQVSLPVKGFGYLIPKSQKSDILGVIFDSETLAEQSTDNQVKLTVMMGHEMCHLNENELKELALKRVSEHLGIKASPEQIHACIHRQCIPQYTVGHQENVDEIQKYIKDQNWPLNLIGSSFTGVGINDVVYGSKLAVLDIESSFHNKNLK